MKHDDFETKVVFRVLGGDVIALFPEIDESNGHCMSYMHMGQHGGADYSGIIKSSRRASPTEYASLKRELESIGYSLKVRMRK